MKTKGFTLIELLIVVAIIAILAAIAVPNFLEAQVRSKVSRVKADQRSLATGLESYYIDANSYPAVDYSGWTGTEGFGANAGLSSPSAELLNMPTFRVKQNDADQLQGLTTPIAYLTNIFTDPFADTNGASFYYSVPGTNIPSVDGSGWIVWSPGPDVDERVDQGNGCGTDIVVNNCGSSAVRVETAYYNPSDVIPSPSLTDATYDPTNGTTSNGDVYRVKQ